jgi:hypothetical protein
LLFRNFASQLGFPTHVPQAAATARIAGKPDIITAAMKGDISLVGDHITAQPSSIHQKDDEYGTASPNLFFISNIVYRKFVYFSFLIFANNSIFFFSPSGRTPLIWSAMKGHVEVCKLLVSSKADVHSSNK